MTVAKAADAPRGPTAVYALDEGDFRRALGQRRHYVSDRGEPLDFEEAVLMAIWMDRFCWLEPGNP